MLLGLKISRSRSNGTKSGILKKEDFWRFILGGILLLNRNRASCEREIGEKKSNGEVDGRD